VGARSAVAERRHGPRWNVEDLTPKKLAEAVPERDRSAAGGMPNAAHGESMLGDPTDRDDGTARAHELDVPAAGLHLGAGRSTVRALGARMGRDDVPEQDVVCELELGEDAVDDRCGRLDRPLPRELALRGERDTGDTSATVSGSLADEEDSSFSSRLEVRDEPSAKKRCPCSLPVLVEGSPDLRFGELPHDALRRYHALSVRGARGNRAERAAGGAADPKNLIWVMPAEEGVSEKLVVVVAGGPAPSVDAALGVPLDASVVAADGGLEHAASLGLRVDVAVGDFDSASADALAAAEAAGARIERHPAAKDATDLELALETALSLSPDRVLVLAGDGGRLDHLLAALLLLGSPRWSSVELDAEIGSARAHVIHGERTLTGRPGELLSLLALHGPAEGVRTEGLEYPLRGDTLQPGSTRGVSNLFVATEARISLERGVLVAVRPDPPDGGDAS
jgi:thiamine pyrophosphokinase